MRQLPILFSTPMVEAILENRKTMTRRTAGLKQINENPNQWIYNQEIKPAFSFFNKASGINQSGKVRYQVGDQLWVKETYFDTRKYRNALLFAFAPDFMYKADNVFIGEHKWKPSLFMPKEAARLWLEVTNVRCERLQDITEADAIAEGIIPQNIKGEEYRLFVNLWESINGKNSWLENPWVFVYTFKRIEKP